MLQALSSGLVLGFVGSMPLAGPIAVLVFARGLHGRFRSARHVAAGAAIAESLYAFFAYWGTSTLLERFPVLEIVSRGAAAAIVTGLGVVFLMSRDGQKALEPRPEQVGGSFALGFTIAALNPTFIATWTAAVTTLHAAGVLPPGNDEALPFAVGVGVGVVSWFWLMVEGLRRGRQRFQPQTLHTALRVIGGALIVMGLWLGLRLFADLWGG